MIKHIHPTMVFAQCSGNQSYAFGEDDGGDDWGDWGDDDWENNNGGDDNDDSDYDDGGGISDNSNSNQINDSLPPCQKAILETIKNFTGNNFNEILEKLNGVSSIYTVNIVTQYNLNDNAVTQLVSGTNGSVISITMDNDHLNNSTQLSIAITILHELIHAYLLSILVDQINTGNSIINNYPEFHNYYLQGQTGSGSVVQHNVIADYFMPSLAASLQEYHTGSPVPAGSQPLQIYSDLSWSGLTNTNAFNALSNEEQLRILAVIIAEEFNAPQSGNGGNIVNPISTPCN